MTKNHDAVFKAKGIVLMIEKCNTTIGAKSIYDTLKASVRKTPDKVFLVFEGMSYTFHGIITQVDKVSSGLYALGLKRGDKVALLLENCPAFTVLYFSLARLGVIMVPLNPKHPHSFVFDIIESIDITVLFVSNSWLSDNNLTPNHIKGKAPCLRNIINIGEGIPSLLNFNDLLNSQELDVILPSTAESAFTIIFTSGSTGKPKGVLHTQKNIILNAQAAIDRLKLHSEDTFLFPFPLSSIFGITWTMIVLKANSCIILMKVFEPEVALSLIEKHKITIHSGNPSIFLAEMYCPELSRYDISSLRTGIIGGHVVGAELLQAIKERLGLKLCNCYGMTEAAGGISLVSPTGDDGEWLKTAGRPLGMAVIAIVGEDGNRVEKGTVGEIACKAEFFAKTYFINGKEVPIPYHSGWFLTEDMGYIDKSGCLCIAGRKKDKVNIQGNIVFTQDIEKTLNAYPSVKSSAVVKKHSDLHAFIIKEPNTILDEEMLMEYITEKLSNSDFVMSMHFVQELPLTATGKTDKLNLIEIYLKQPA